eukprot:1184462-Prorocentrum_minimum.AAC.2
MNSYRLPSCDWFSRGVYTASPLAIDARRVALGREVTKCVVYAAGAHPVAPAGGQLPQEGVRGEVGLELVVDLLREHVPLDDVRVRLHDHVHWEDVLQE